MMGSGEHNEEWESYSLTEQLWVFSTDLLELKEISSPIFVVKRCDDYNFGTFE